MAPFGSREAHILQESWPIFSTPCTYSPVAASRNREAPKGSLCKHQYVSGFSQVFRKTGERKREQERERERKRERENKNQRCVLVDFLSHFGTVFAPFWLHFGTFLVSFWLHFGDFWCPGELRDTGSRFGRLFGVFLAPFWPSWLHFGSILGPILHHFSLHFRCRCSDVFLMMFLLVLGPLWAPFWVHFS